MTPVRVPSVHTIDRSVGRSAWQSVSLAVSRPGVGRVASGRVRSAQVWSAVRSVDRSVGRPGGRSAWRSVGLTVGQSIGRSDLVGSGRPIGRVGQTVCL